MVVSYLLLLKELHGRTRRPKPSMIRLTFVIIACGKSNQSIAPDVIIGHGCKCKWSHGKRTLLL